MKTKVVKAVFNCNFSMKKARTKLANFVCLTLVILESFFPKADGFGRLDQKPMEKRFISLVTHWLKITKNHKKMAHLKLVKMLFSNSCTFLEKVKLAIFSHMILRWVTNLNFLILCIILENSVPILHARFQSAVYKILEVWKTKMYRNGRSRWH